MNDLLWRIQSEFLEMPGLRLTPEQAARLWGLDRQTCAEVLAALVCERFLTCAADGRYTRLTEGRVAWREISPTHCENLPRLPLTA